MPVQLDPLIKLVWSALWRAQAAHLAAFVCLPLLVASVRAAIGIILLPVLLLGEGDRSVGLGASVSHLSAAGCWVALMPCPLADRTLFELPGMGSQRSEDPAQSPGALEQEPFLPLPTSFTGRHGWFFVWLAWFIVFLFRRERAGDRA